MILNNSKTDSEIDGESKETPLHLASALNRLDCVDALLRHRSSICRANADGLTSIHIAAMKGSADVLNHFLTAGNSFYSPAQLLKVEDNEKGTPLHAAVLGGALESVKILLNYGASIMAQTDGLATPLHLACSQGSLGMVNVMCEYGKGEELVESLGLKDDQGMTPLHRYELLGKR